MFKSLPRLVGAVAAGAGICALAWSLTTTPSVESVSAERPNEALASSSAAMSTTAPEPTQAPTATALPVPTPTPLPFDEAFPLGTLADALASPLPECSLVANPVSVAGTVTLTCRDQWSSVGVMSAADGRIVHISTQAAVPGSDPAPPGWWSWAAQGALGPHVVVDHGPIGGTTTTQTVYAGLATIAEGARIGDVVSAGQPLGTVAGPGASLRFSVWADGVRQDGAEMLVASPPAEQQQAAAEALRAVIASPIDDRCPLVRASGQLPGAPRYYRNGIHRGIDFGCGSAERSVFSIADGTVVYMVDDYGDPSVANREALLGSAAQAASTPEWTLVMLYGNVVIIDHGVIPGAGRVVTISAHLENVDESVVLGGPVTKGQRIGEAGNRGTNAASLGIRGADDPTLHLHWELMIDNWFLGAGLDSSTVVSVITTLLCGPAQTAGCPA